MFLMSDKFVVCEVALVFALTRFVFFFVLNLLITSPASPSSNCCSASSSSSSSSSANSRTITKNLSLTTFGDIHHTPENQDVDAISCAVCLNRLRMKSQVWELSNCTHVFHKHCLERWMASHDTCPLCRASLVADERLQPPAPPSWAVERMLYLFGDDLLP